MLKFTSEILTFNAKKYVVQHIFYHKSDKIVA